MAGGAVRARRQSEVMGSRGATAGVIHYLGKWWIVGRGWETIFRSVSAEVGKRQPGQRFGPTAGGEEGRKEGRELRMFPGRRDTRPKVHLTLKYNLSTSVVSVIVHRSCTVTAVTGRQQS